MSATQSSLPAPASEQDGPVLVAPGSPIMDANSWPALPGLASPQPPTPPKASPKAAPPPSTVSCQFISVSDLLTIGVGFRISA